MSRCVECDLAEPESLASLGGSAPGVVDGILSQMYHSLGDLLPPVLSWSSLVSLQRFFHRTQVFSQHIFLDLQQDFHLHLLYIHIQGDN